MRLVILISLLALAASCGQSSGTNRVPAERDQQRLPSTGTNPDDTSAEVDASEVEVTEPADLMNVTLDENVQITDSEIIFLRSNSVSDAGVRNLCTLSVNQGESYQYYLRGNELEIITRDGGRYVMKRTGAPGNSLVGSWTWTGRESNMLVHRRLSVVNMSKVILVSNCEG